MNAPAEFSYAAAEQSLGQQAMEEARKRAATAPPLRPELREQLRALFASTRIAVLQAPAADAA